MEKRLEESPKTLLPRMCVPAVGTEGVGLAAEGSVAWQRKAVLCRGGGQAECPLHAAGTREN